MRHRGSVASAGPRRSHTVVMKRRSLLNSPLRAIALGLALLFVATACAALPSAFFAGEPATTASAPPPTVCESGADLRLAIDRLRELDLEDSSLLDVLVTVDVAVSSARQFANVVGEQYRPLATDLVVSLEGLRTTVEDLGDQETLGASIATVGASIVEIGEAMDAIGVELRTPCPSPIPE